MQGKEPVLAPAFRPKVSSVTPGLFCPNGVPARGISNFRCSQIARTEKPLREIRHPAEDRAETAQGVKTKLL
jgi:hypothetical protein